MLVHGKHECPAMQTLYVCVPRDPAPVLNAASYMNCSLSMLVEDTRGDNMEEAYSSAL